LAAFDIIGNKTKLSKVIDVFWILN